MKKIYLHIGTHKTGTTAVQVFAEKYSKQLKKIGLLYPQTGRPCKVVPEGHHLLPWTQLNHVAWKEPWGQYQDNPERVWDDLLTEISESECQDAFISSEEFDVLDETGVAYVAERLKGVDVQVICYLRRLDEFVQSYYITDVLYHGEGRDIRTYMEDMRTTKNYFKLVTRWKNAFGDKNVHTFFYLRNNLKNEDIVLDVFSRCGYDVSTQRKGVVSKRVNRSGLSSKSIETLRMFNAYGMPRDVVLKFVRVLQLLDSSKSNEARCLMDKETVENLIGYGLDCIEKIGSEDFSVQVKEKFSKVPDIIQDQSVPTGKNSYNKMKQCFMEIESALNK